ncbi:hypothetical protein ACFY05_32995 [Microtetraspora fusca]|uniref:Uncharacterized protein n=1 Tax=Microtetraspora fusca TaxID=1997 RepID=A0ABW6VEC4_MICFU
MQTTATTDQITTFEHLLDLEFVAKSEKAGVACQGAGVPLWRKQQMHDNAKRAQTELFTALDALTDEEKSLYGTYRREVLAKYATR